MKHIAQDKNAHRTGCQIDDLLSPDQSFDSPTQLWRSAQYPDTLLQVTITPDGSPKEPRLTRAFENGPLSTFKLTMTPGEDDPDGVVGLVDATSGIPLKAQCVEAALSPSVFAEGQALSGWLDMYVSQLCSLSDEEEGEDSYGLECDADKPVYATVSGLILDVERVESADTSLTHITIDIVPLGGRGVTCVHLYLHDDVLGTHKAELCNYISCRGVLHFTPDSLEKPKEEKELRTIEDVFSYLRHDMDLVYCIDMDGDARLDYSDETHVYMSFKDDQSNNLNAGSQSDVQLGSIRLFSHLHCHADTAKILELCNDANHHRLLAKAYYNDWVDRIVVEYYLIPDGAPIPSSMFEFSYRCFVREMHKINDQIRELEDNSEDDDYPELDDADLFPDDDTDSESEDAGTDAPQPGIVPDQA